MKLLTNIEFHTDTNNWFAPTKELKEKYPSVIGTELMDTTSSAGDWDGFLIQKTGKNSYKAIGFSQENCYPDAGFTLRTCEHPFYHGKLTDANWAENVRNCWLQCTPLV